jgi:hypothetical protein
MEEGKSIWVAPYIAFRTVLDLIERMAVNGAPPQIDRSYLHTYSGGYRSQVIAALTSLGLLNENTNVQQPLLDLVAADEAKRKVLMGELVNTFYGEAVELAKIKATTKQLEDLFAEKYGLSGNTKAKGIAFYLNASKWAGVTVSPNFRTPTTTPSSKKRRTTAQAPPVQQPSAPSPPPAQREPTYEVDLRSGGGSVRLSVQVDLFALSEEDRAFVFGLVDWVRKYQSQTGDEDPVSHPDTQSMDEGGDP